eukprot:TRINITY_DN16134_c0_g1_i1.p1 TRINITY_DN16134_c0_g1~~TRINITY_DN16134_c0_g1_i1.p1  ORF type:complete len:243 (-),score=65.46 TRINITY_DN16134_c0_g1_i1:173-901(-)
MPANLPVQKPWLKQVIGAAHCGKALVEFASEDVARKALEELNLQNLDGRPIYVKPFSDFKQKLEANLETSIFVCNIGWETRGWQLKEHFEKAGKVLSYEQLEGGKAFVTFASAADQQAALDMGSEQQLNGRPIWVKQKVLKKDRERPDCKISVVNISYATKGWQLKEHFQKFGKVVRYDREEGTGKAAVEFSSPDEAAAALHAGEEQHLDDRAVYVKSFEPAWGQVGDCSEERNAATVRPQH